MPPPSPRTPAASLPSHTLAIGQALAASAPLALLGQRMRDSQARLQAVLTLLPSAMQACVRAGPIDEEGWSLLASNSAVAAKLRQMSPSLDAHLHGCGWAGPPVRVKLLSKP